MSKLLGDSSGKYRSAGSQRGHTICYIYVVPSLAKTFPKARSTFVVRIAPRACCPFGVPWGPNSATLLVKLLLGGGPELWGADGKATMD